MTSNGWLQIAVFFALVMLAARPMGLYMARVYERERTWLDPVLGPIERLLYRVTGVNADEEMRWTEYAAAMLIFSLVTMLLTYAVERMQGCDRRQLLQPPAPSRSRAASGVEHRSLVYHQHQLAGVCAGDDDELPDPDVRTGSAQLLVGGDRAWRWRSRSSAGLRGGR